MTPLIAVDHGLRIQRHSMILYQLLHCFQNKLYPERFTQHVFIAQHATATCCRECIRKWHKMQPGKELSQIQQEYLVDVIMTWIEKELEAYGTKKEEKES